MPSFQPKCCWHRTNCGTPLRTGGCCVSWRAPFAPGALLVVTACCLLCAASLLPLPALLLSAHQSSSLQVPLLLLSSLSVFQEGESDPSEVPEVSWLSLPDDAALGTACGPAEVNGKTLDGCPAAVVCMVRSARTE